MRFHKGCILRSVGLAKMLGRSYSRDIYVGKMETSYNKLLDLVFETRSPEFEY